MFNVICSVLDPTQVDDWGTGGAVADLSLIMLTAMFPIVGMLIIHRQPRNTIGWLLHATGIAWGVGALTDGYARLALQRHRRPCPAARRSRCSTRCCGGHPSC